MKKAIFFAVFALLITSLAAQPSGITGNCQTGGTYPSCVGGEIVFVGTNYPEHVHIRVTNSAGTVIDDGDYQTEGGTLRFTENLSFADTYTISINGTVALTVTTS
jgi:hypothetical protein